MANHPFCEGVLLPNLFSDVSQTLIFIRTGILILSIYPSLCSEESPHYSLTTFCAVPWLLQWSVFPTQSTCECEFVCSFSKQCSSLQAKHKTWHVWYKQIQCYAVLTIQLGIWLLLRLKEALLLLAGLHGCGLNLTACYSSFFARLPVFIFDFFF